MSQPSAPRNNNSTSPRSPKLDVEDKIPHPDFTGKWRLAEYKGIDEYLKSEGWSWMMRKAISKLGNNQFIYHHHESRYDGVEEENLTIKSVYKGGIYEIISNANLNDKKEIKYKDKNGDKIISVFKWNKEKNEIIEFLLKEISSNTLYSPTHNINDHNKNRRKKARIKQKSYTKCRYMDSKGRMIERITNEIGKECISIYVKDNDDESLSIKQLKNILHLPITDSKNNSEQNTSILPQFPLNIFDIILITEKNDEDDDKLTVENIRIQKQIAEINAEMDILKAKLAAKTQELKTNILANDVVISNKNMMNKWKEFESEWSKWDTLYFMGWLERIRWKNKSFGEYKNLNKKSINKYCMLNFNSRHFIGKYLVKFDRDAIRQIGIQDEQDSFCIYQQIIELIGKNPLKKYESPLKYQNKRKKNEINVNNELEVKDVDVNDLDDLYKVLNDIGLSEYYEIFKKNGFEDMNTIVACIKHKGSEYVEENILAHKMKINKIGHRMKLLNAFKQYVETDKLV